MLAYDVMSVEIAVALVPGELVFAEEVEELTTDGAPIADG
jgi:hypothetical protein